MALEMLTALGDLNRERGTHLCLRIGLNSGPVVAGVIGRKKFAYDLWGAAVNVANCMQSSGLPKQIQVPAGMIELLGDKFRLTERGVVDCKGLGQIRTYLLERPDGSRGRGKPALRRCPGKLPRRDNYWSVIAFFDPKIIS